MSRFPGGLVKHLGKRLVAKNNQADSLTDAEIHAWIDAGELVTV